RAGGQPGVDEGTVALWSVAGDFGIAAGLGVPAALGLYRDEWEGPVTLAAPAVGVLIGLGSLAGARAWGEAERYTVGDARALRSFGLLGAQAVWPVVDAAFRNSDAHLRTRAVVGSMVVGSAVGLYVGNRVLR